MLQSVLATDITRDEQRDVRRTMNGLADELTDTDGQHSADVEM